MEYRSLYVGYVKKCPKCERRGSLYAYYHRYATSSEWNGPYFKIFHYKDVFSPTKFKQLRAMGMVNKMLDGKKVSGSQYCDKQYVGCCYIGKEGYVLTTKPVRRP